MFERDQPAVTPHLVRQRRTGEPPGGPTAEVEAGLGEALDRVRAHLEAACRHLGIAGPSAR